MQIEMDSECHVYLPTCFTRGTEDTPHPLMLAKRASVSNGICYDKYNARVVQAMRRKNGVVRKMNCMTVQGSCRMVILPWCADKGGSISIPACHCNCHCYSIMVIIVLIVIIVIVVVVLIFNFNFLCHYNYCCR